MIQMVYILGWGVGPADLLLADRNFALAEFRLSYGLLNIYFVRGKRISLRFTTVRVRYSDYQVLDGCSLPGFRGARTI